MIVEELVIYMMSEQIKNNGSQLNNVKQTMRESMRLEVITCELSIEVLRLFLPTSAKAEKPTINIR